MFAHRSLNSAPPHRRDATWERPSDLGYLSPMTTANRVDTVIVGAGFGGIAAAIKLRERGISDLMVVERAGDLGGAWRGGRSRGRGGAGCQGRQ